MINLIKNLVEGIRWYICYGKKIDYLLRTVETQTLKLGEEMEDTECERHYLRTRIEELEYQLEMFIADYTEHTESNSKQFSYLRRDLGIVSNKFSKSL